MEVDNFAHASVGLSAKIRVHFSFGSPGAFGVTNKRLYPRTVSIRVYRGKQGTYNGWASCPIVFPL